MPLDISKLKQYKTVVFGPFIGEFGWEIIRWSGIVRSFKKNNPNIRVVICTRENRQDLYTNAVDHKILFNYEGDYEKLSPNCYDCSGFSDSLYTTLLNSIKEEEPEAFILEPRQYKCQKDLFSFSDMDFDYHPAPSNKQVIDRILLNDPGRIPIVITSRHRDDINTRNWGTTRWKSMFDMIQQSEKYFVFVSGVSPSYYKASEDRQYFYNLEDYASRELNTTVVGLTIEAMRSSVLTMGTQTAAIILSNLLRTPTLFWGDQAKRHAILENPGKTLSYGIEDRLYQTDPFIVFGHLKRMTIKRNNCK